MLKKFGNTSKVPACHPAGAAEAYRIDAMIVTGDMTA